MYSKTTMVKFIDAAITQQGKTRKEVAEAIGMTPSNLARVLEKEGYNFTLAQFGQLVGYLDLTPDQAYYILTGKKKKEAITQAVAKAAEILVENIEGTHNRPSNQKLKF